MQVNLTERQVVIIASILQDIQIFREIENRFPEFRDVEIDGVMNVFDELIENINSW